MRFCYLCISCFAIIVLACAGSVSEKKGDEKKEQQKKDAEPTANNTELDAERAARAFVRNELVCHNFDPQSVEFSDVNVISNPLGPADLKGCWSVSGHVTARRPGNENELFNFVEDVILKGEKWHNRVNYIHWDLLALSKSKKDAADVILAANVVISRRLGFDSWDLKSRFHCIYGVQANPAPTNQSHEVSWVVTGTISQQQPPQPRTYSTFAAVVRKDAETWKVMEMKIQPIAKAP